MSLKQRVVPGLLLAVLTATAAHAQVAGKVTAVRVYRGQALVTRVIDFQAAAGAQEVVVSGLPERVVPDSLYCTGDEGQVAIRAVRFRAEAVSDEPRDEVRVLDDQIAEQEDAIAKVAAELEVLEKHSDYLDKLEAFVAPTATAEMSKGVLDPEALLKLTQNALEQRTMIATKGLDLARQNKKLQAELAVLQRKRAQLAAGGSRAAREAVVFVECRQAGAARLELNYLVSGVSWAPAYLARLNSKLDRLALEYHAVVSQASGEDWADVALTLSTGTASMAADSPVLAPLYVALSTAPTSPTRPAGPTAGKDGATGVDAKAYAQQRRELEEQIRADKPRQSAANQADAAGGMGGVANEPGALPSGTFDRDALAQANVLAAKLQQLELTASDDAVRGARRVGDGREGLAVDYPLPGKVSLQSRNDQQMFRIAALDLKPSFYYTAVPLLSDFVYQAVEAQNTSPVALLPGPYSAYVEGAYAGQGRLPLVASGEAVTIGFGTESRLKVVRELEEKKTELRGGNKQLKYTYRFRLQNFTDRPATVRVWDRLPQTPSDQVAVTIVDGGPELSKDPLYLEQERPRGLLRWDIEVPANAAGATAKTFPFQYQLEFDKNYNIGALPPELEERMKRDLEALPAMRGR